MILTGSSTSALGEGMHLAPMRCMDHVGDDAEVASDDEVLLLLPLVVGRDIVILDHV